MAERIIRKFGDPVLREKCKPVANIANILNLLDDMAETLGSASNGAALAAPQVGVAKRIVVINLGGKMLELINPEVVASSGEQTGPEGCLSLPGYFGKVKRANQVVVKALNRNGEEIAIEAEEFLARCLQHEIDHLDGILYIDRVASGHLYSEKTGDPVDILPFLALSKPEA
ncbi:MAG TPA: peptide deformylase [Selenomonadales bacterium]|nr:peptide deformylase [Selenomonadales bacterium]